MVNGIGGSKSMLASSLVLFVSSSGTTNLKSSNKDRRGE
jgi:hypothetical protein